MLPNGGNDELKQTNEIGMAIPLLETVDIGNKTLTADALLTQRKIAQYLIDRNAHYVFTVKGNQSALHEAIRLLFEAPAPADFCEPLELGHGRIVQRRIWTSARLNDYLSFPGVGQVFRIERHVTEKKTHKQSTDVVYGITSHSPDTADAARILAYNRQHWSVESCHYVIDWNWDEDRCRIRSGHGPENTTALRRFASGIIRSRSKDSVSATIQRLGRNVRMVFDYLRMTDNSRPRLARNQVVAA